MNKDYQRYLIAAGIVLVVLLLLLFILSSASRQKPTKVTPTTFPTPTTYNTFNPTKEIPQGVPTLIPAVDFTGAIDEPLPKEVADLVDQKNSLIDKTPLHGNYFTVTFSYKTDKFTVELKDPKAENQIKFEQWLKLNYSAIPLDRFIIK